MPTVGLQIGVLVVLRIEVSTQVVVVLDEEVSLTDTNPEQFGILLEQLVDFAITVLLDVGMSVGVRLLLVDSGREQTYIVEQVRIVDRDK